MRPNYHACQSPHPLRMHTRRGGDQQPRLLLSFSSNPTPLHTHQTARLTSVLHVPDSPPMHGNRTAFPTPHQFPQIGGGGLPAKNLQPFWPLLATPGRGQTISGAAAMTVPSSIGTGTPAPAIRLPLDPAPTHPRERPFRRNRACDLIFKRDRQRCGDGASPKRPVCHSHSPHPQLPT